MSQDEHSRTSRTSPRARGGVARTLLRLILLLSIVGILLVAAGLLLRTLNQRGGAVDVPVQLRANPGLNPVESAALAIYLAANGAELNTPADPNAATQYFNIEPGQHAALVAQNLYDQGLVTDPTLFRRYLSYYGLDVQLEAGTYELTASMTIPEIAYQLTEAEPAEITLSIPEGWRREQIADWLDQQPDAPFTGSDFLAASGPGAALPAEVTFGSEIPPGASLEGFLFPDTYRLSLDATAQDLVDRMLLNFEQRVTQDLRAGGAQNGLSLYEVVTVASIVEREARAPDERPLIADVYLNRLEQGMKLEADPTVQYAMGYQPDTGQWWNLGLTQADYYAVDSPYNTYLYTGLPPGPIANPGLDAIEAVVRPADTPYLYFRTTCDGSGRHNFAITFEEHVANACP